MVCHLENVGGSFALGSGVARSRSTRQRQRRRWTLSVVPVVGNAKRIMVMWLIPVNQSHSDFLLPPHSKTSLYRDLLSDWRTHRPLLSNTAVVYSTGDAQHEWVESGFTWSQNVSRFVGVCYQKRFRVQVAHDDDSHNDAMYPDALWKRVLSAFTTSTNASTSFCMFATCLAYLKRHGFPSAFFYYAMKGTSTKGDAGDWGNAGNLDIQNGEGWWGVSCAMNDMS